jgi:hypothetical protein
MNGTMHNGVRCEEHTLVEGDILTLGMCNGTAPLLACVVCLLRLVCVVRLVAL